MLTEDEETFQPLKFSERLRQYSTKAAARTGGTPAAAEAGGVCIEDP